MARTTDELLDRVLRSALSPLASPDDDREALEAFLELDQILRTGGPLPAAWVPAAERGIQDVTLPGQNGGAYKPPGGRHRIGYVPPAQPESETA